MEFTTKFRQVNCEENVWDIYHSLRVKKKTAVAALGTCDWRIYPSFSKFTPRDNHLFGMLIRFCKVAKYTFEELNSHLKVYKLPTPALPSMSSFKLCNFCLYNYIIMHFQKIRNKKGNFYIGNLPFWFHPLKHLLGEVQDPLLPNQCSQAPSCWSICQPIDSCGSRPSPLINPLILWGH